MKLSDEQAHVVELVRGGGHVVVTAAAGAGKTSTIAEAAKLTPRSLMMVFNKSAAEDAKARFPTHTQCRTVHSLAFATHGKPVAHRLNQRARAADLARLLGTSPLQFTTQVGTVTERRSVSNVKVASLAQQTVREFCRTADRDLTADHAPRLAGLDAAANDALAAEVVGYARRLWADWSNPTGRLPGCGHDAYLKAWQLSDPRLNCSTLYLDEAQDLSGVMAAVADANRNRLARARKHRPRSAALRAREVSRRTRLDP